jgi:hypothetical protein
LPAPFVDVPPIAAVPDVVRLAPVSNEIALFELDAETEIDPDPVTVSELALLRSSPTPEFATPVIERTPAPAFKTASFRATAVPEPELIELIVKAPPPVDKVEEMMLTAPPDAVRLRAPPKVSIVVDVKARGPVWLGARSAVSVTACPWVEIEAPETPVIDVAARMEMDPAELPDPVARAPSMVTLPEPAGD